MCQLCADTQKERDDERNRLDAQADKLRSLAAALNSMAQGSIKPHGELATVVKAKAHSVIRSLVEGWV